MEVSDLFGKAGAGAGSNVRQSWPIEERATLDSGLRQIDFLDGEVASVDRVIGMIAAETLSRLYLRRLMTVPGVNLIVVQQPS